jgi:O-antigen/teichoic acid export membrane protein
LLAPWVITFVYGSDFAPSAALVPLLAIHPLIAGIGIAAGPIFRAYGRNLWAVYANLSVLVVGLPLAYGLVQQLGLEGSALAYALLATTLEVVAYGICLKIVSGGKIRP